MWYTVKSSMAWHGMYWCYKSTQYALYFPSFCDGDKNFWLLNWPLITWSCFETLLDLLIYWIRFARLLIRKWPRPMVMLCVLTLAGLAIMEYAYETPCVNWHLLVVSSFSTVWGGADAYALGKFMLQDTPTLILTYAHVQIQTCSIFCCLNGILIPWLLLVYELDLLISLRSPSQMEVQGTLRWLPFEPGQFLSKLIEALRHHCTDHKYILVATDRYYCCVLIPYLLVSYGLL